MNLRTVTICTTFVILIAMSVLFFFYYLSVDVKPSPVAVRTFAVLAGVPLLLNLIFAWFYKNRISGLILLIAAVLYSVPLFVILFLMRDNNTEYFYKQIFAAIFYVFCILFPCWIIAYSVEVFRKVTCQETVNVPSESHQKVPAIPVPLSCPICKRTPELIQSPECVCLQCEGPIYKKLRTEHQLKTQNFETEAEAIVEWNTMVRHIRRDNPLILCLQAIFRRTAAAPRSAAIWTTRVLITALLALGLFFSWYHIDSAGYLAFLLSLFACLPLVVNLSLLRFFKNRVSETSLLIAAVFYSIPVFFQFIMVHRENLKTDGIVYFSFPVAFLISGVFIMLPGWLIAVGAELYIRLTRRRTSAGDSPAESM